MFIGYAYNSAAYRFLVVKSDVMEHNIIVESKNADFFEHVFPLKSHVDKIAHVPEIASVDKSVDNENVEIELRRSKRARK